MNELKESLLKKNQISKKNLIKIVKCLKFVIIKYL